MIDGGCDLVSGGTDTHLMLVDLRKKGVTGKAAEAVPGPRLHHLQQERHSVRPGALHHHQRHPPRHAGRNDARLRRRPSSSEVGALITEVLDGLAKNGEEGNGKVRRPSVAQAGQGADRPLPDLLTRSMRWPGLTRPPRLGTVTRPPAAAGGIRGFPGLRCPFCSNEETQVKDSRPTEDGTAIRRRRYCPDCSGRFTTFERVQLRELMVLKKSGRRVPFDRDKLMRSIQVALRKRPVDPERVERMVSGIVRRLESLGESEIKSETVGKLVMEALKMLDDVAYVRFASVYKNFREAKDFEELLGELSGDEDDGETGDR